MNKRLFLTRVVKGLSVLSLGLFSYPFIKSLIPGFSEDLTFEISIDGLAVGESKISRWRGRNVLVVRRTPVALSVLANDEVPLKDADSTDSTQPVFAQNSWRSRREDVFVGFANCTHLGCEVTSKPDGIESRGLMETHVGFVCPCHNSHYDHAGRVLEGAAAPLNLEVPNYRFASRNLIILEPLES